MIFSTKTVTVLISLLACLAARANADCNTDLQSAEWIKFGEDVEALEDSGDISAIPQLCLDAGGDVFAYSGTTTCGGVAGDETETALFEPNCLPTSCTTSGDEAALSAIIASMNAPDAPDDVDAPTCTGEYTFDAIGEGSPDSLQCAIDMAALETNPEALTAFFTARILADMFAALTPSPPDYSALPALCEAAEGHHYFTFNATQTCDDEEDNGDVTGVPSCLPESCADSDEAIVEAMVVAVEEGVNENCTLSALVFDGLDDHDDHDSHQDHDGHDDYDSHDDHDGHDHGSTSGAFSYASSIVAGMLMLAGVATAF